MARLIVDRVGRSGADNMAIDAALLDEAARTGTVSMRLYRWSPGCLSFGRHEPAATRYDRQRIETLGLDTVRRPTGGRAVWHDREVTYAVAGPERCFGSLRQTYHAIHAILADAMRTLGVEADLAPTRGTMKPDAGACFAAPVGGEVIVAGRKLIGSAQVRDRRAFLQHGSILLEDGQDVVAAVTRGSPPRAYATSLAALLARHVTFEEVTDAVAATVRERWPQDWGLADAPRASNGVFADPDWTWRR